MEIERLALWIFFLSAVFFITFFLMENIHLEIHYGDKLIFFVRHIILYFFEISFQFIVNEIIITNQSFNLYLRFNFNSTYHRRGKWLNSSARWNFPEWQRIGVNTYKSNDRKQSIGTTSGYGRSWSSNILGTCQNPWIFSGIIVFFLIFEIYKFHDFLIRIS